MSNNTTSREFEAKAERADRLFRAAVSSYCSLIKPSKYDAARLDDLTLPLLPMVSREGRRYAAAALSEAAPQTAMLIKLLADDVLEISAPLLMRSSNLSDVDLIGLIGRHGIPHARAIAQRANLNPNIARLTSALGAAADGADAQNTDADASEGPAPRADAAGDVRARLRGMMRPAGQPIATVGGGSSVTTHEPLDWDAALAACPRLLSTALSGLDAFFHTALADVLDVSFGAAQTLGDDNGPGLTAVLHALDLPVEQAFLIAALIYPLGFTTHGRIAEFVRAHRCRDRAAARKSVEAWRAWDVGRRIATAVALAPAEAAEEPANDSGQAMLKVS